MSKKQSPNPNNKSSTQPTQNTKDSRQLAKESLTQRWEEFVTQKPSTKHKGSTNDTLTREDFLNVLGRASRQVDPQRAKEKVIIP